MTQSRAQWMRLKTEIRLAIAAWLVSKAQDLTPATDVRTHIAFGVLLSSMMADDAGMERCRAWEKTKDDDSPREAP